MVDLHNHTMFSPDSDARPEDMIEAAIRAGSPAVGFSEHVDFDYVPSPLEVVHECGAADVAAYFTYFAPLKQKYAGRIEVLTGLEFGYNPYADMDGFRRIERDFSPDYVINSVHVAHGVECFWGENLARLTKRQAYETYLSAVLDSLNAPYRYEIVGHIGYVTRNAPYEDRAMRYAEYSDLLDEILRRIVASGVSLELNTSARQAATPYLPGREILARYVELGGENVTFASDSHEPTRLLEKYPLVRDDLLSLGIRYLDVYRGRQREKHRI